ncbi:unnamed protein product, partial [Prorocentrum cordatum]
DPRYSSALVVLLNARDGDVWRAAAGQLKKIAEVFSRFNVGIVSIHVQSGIADNEKGDFVPASGGPLGENRVRIVFDESALDVEALRQEIERVGQRSGYALTSLMTESLFNPRAWLPGYMLRRKAFTIAYLSIMAADGNKSASKSWRLRPPGRLPAVLAARA